MPEQEQAHLTLRFAPSARMPQAQQGPRPRTRTRRRRPLRLDHGGSWIELGSMRTKMPRGQPQRGRNASLPPRPFSHGIRSGRSLQLFLERADGSQDGYVTHRVSAYLVFFWAPAMKWGIVLAGINDLFRPADQISVAQNAALALTGSIWVRYVPLYSLSYCFVIHPVNYSLAAVNFFVGSNGLVQLARVAQYVVHAHTVTVIRTLRRPRSPLLLRRRPTPSHTEGTGGSGQTL